MSVKKLRQAIILLVAHNGLKLTWPDNKHCSLFFRMSHSALWLALQERRTETAKIEEFKEIFTVAKFKVDCSRSTTQRCSILQQMVHLNIC